MVRLSGKWYHFFVCTADLLAYTAVSHVFTAVSPVYTAVLHVYTAVLRARAPASRAYTFQKIPFTFTGRAANAVYKGIPAIFYPAIAFTKLSPNFHQVTNG